MSRYSPDADRRRLARAIASHAGWRGSLHPDEWNEFKAEVKLMRAALRRLHRAAKKLPDPETYSHSPEDR